MERLNVSEAMQQAINDASGRVPVVAHRRNREPWLVTMRLEDWINDGRGKSEHHAHESDPRQMS